MPFSMRFTRPASTLPGPTSMACVTPSSAIFWMVASHRTTPSIWRMSKSFTRVGSLFGAASTLAITGNANGAIATSDRWASITRAAGAINAQWNGALTLRGMTLPLRSVHSLPARSTAAACPAMTICVPLKFAGDTTSPCAASRHTASTVATSSPITAAIAPTPGGTASCMACPRMRTRRIASDSSSAPAATSALYSPRL